MKRNVNISILGDSSTQFYSKYLKEALEKENLSIKIYEGNFGNIDHELIDEDSLFHDSKPDIVIFYNSYQSLYKEFLAYPQNKRTMFFEEIITRFERRIATLDKNMIFFNYPQISERILGNNDNKYVFSFLYQIRKINQELVELSIKHDKLDILDVELLSAEIGYEKAFDKRFYYSFNQVFSKDFISVLADYTASIILAKEGRVLKLIITDLDNTLWGGIVGEDGIKNIHIGELGVGHIFSDIQKFLKQLLSTGVLLAVVSKNDEKIAQDAFLKHPDMPLSLEDFILFKANWEPKSSNILEILNQLNIRSKNVMFLDDSIREREEVRENIEDIFIPELPEDAAFYLDTIRNSLITQREVPTIEDSQRTKLYKQRKDRENNSKKYTNIEEFLKHLDMKAKVFEEDDFMIPRISQLTQRTNQFNLRTKRYTSSDIKGFYESISHKVFAYSLKDRFGDNGTVGVLIVEDNGEDSWFIDTFLLSCRVFKKTFEHFMINDLVLKAEKAGIKNIIGEFIDSGRNAYVKDLYSNLGFKKDKNIWKLSVKDWKPISTFVS